MASITSSSAALAATTALAAGAYLNAKFSIATDLRELWNDRDWFKRLQGLIRELGDDCTLYHLLEIATTANAEREALWFEGLVWTYRQLKDGKCAISKG